MRIGKECFVSGIVRCGIYGSAVRVCKVMINADVRDLITYIPRDGYTTLTRCGHILTLYNRGSYTEMYGSKIRHGKY